MKKLTICLAATAALAVPATAGAAEKFYGGNIANGGKIGIDVTTQGGEAFQVDAMRYKNLPANCTILGPALIGGTFQFTNLLVVNNKFEIDDTAPNGDELFLKGTFRQQDAKVAGRLKVGPADYGSAGDCTSAERGYDAKRGAKGPHPKDLRAKVARAFRVAR